MKQRTPPRVWVLASSALHKMRLVFYPQRVVKHRFAGVELCVVLADHTASPWYDWDWGRGPRNSGNYYSTG